MKLGLALILALLALLFCAVTYAGNIDAEALAFCQKTTDDVSQCLEDLGYSPTTWEKLTGYNEIESRLETCLNAHLKPTQAVYDH